MDKSYGALVIGGGINGLSALYHLQRLGCKPLGLVERFALGHERGSSHGHSRITRSAYINAGYVRLMQVVHRQEWPRLERDAGQRLLHPTPGCFFGPPGGKYPAYAQAVLQAGVEAEAIPVEVARRRFPLFRFPGVDEVLHDHTAALVAAAHTLAALVRLCRQGGAEIHEQTQVLEIDPSRDPIQVRTERGVLETERLVVTAGPWTASLLPWLKARLQVARQAVGYFVLRGDQEALGPGRFPVWGYLGEEEYYGLPQFGRPGIKLARHLTTGRDDDPDKDATPLPEGEEARLRRIIADHLALPVEHLDGVERCLYTNTATEDFIIDLHPQNPHLAIGASCSGHGFKFGPLTGRALAELVLSGKTAIPEFEQMRPTFAARR